MLWCSLFAKNEKQDWNFLTLNSAIKRIFKFNALFGAHPHHWFEEIYIIYIIQNIYIFPHTLFLLKIILYPLSTVKISPFSPLYLCFFYSKFLYFLPQSITTPVCFEDIPLAAIWSVMLSVGSSWTWIFH